MHIAIIGNGIAGITAARTIRRMDAECRITVISKESKHFFSRTALMYVYMGHMTFDHTKPYEDHFWSKNRIDLVQDHVSKVDFVKQLLMLDKGGELQFDKLLLATGSKSNKFGWPGQDLNGVQGLYSYQDLELLEANTHKAFTPASKQKVQRAVIVGGGLIGIELAEMLMTRNIQVTFLIREGLFWGNVLPENDGKLIDRHLKQHGIELLYHSELQEIKGNKEGRVESVLTKDGKVLECQFVGLTTGVSPNVDFLKGSVLDVQRGIRVKRNLETNLKNVYAAGDCAEFIEPAEGRRSIEQVWYTGRMMGEIAGKNICGKNEQYDPGPWFNSAKFFDIEYQTYGLVNAELKEGEVDFYWENEKGDKALHLVFGSETQEIKGLNVFGIRLRHEVMDKWLKEKLNVESLLKNWHKVLFDAEFSKNVIHDIIEQYNLKFNTNVSKPKSTWLQRML